MRGKLTDPKLRIRLRRYQRRLRVPSDRRWVIHLQHSQSLPSPHSGRMPNPIIHADLRLNALEPIFASCRVSLLSVCVGVYQLKFTIAKSEANEISRSDTDFSSPHQKSWDIVRPKFYFIPNAADATIPKMYCYR